MIYETRQEVERIGMAGSKFYDTGNTYVARVLSSFWLSLDKFDLGFTPHMTHKGEGFWEAWITSWMSKQVKPGMHTIDVGANHGYYAFMMQQAGAQCMAIEPQRKLCDRMYDSNDLNKHMKGYVEIVQAAVSDRHGDIVILDTPQGHGMNASISSFYHPNAPHGSSAETVKTVTLDAIVSPFSKTEFVKIDVEGAEQQVWDGMQRLWKRHRPVTLLEFRWDRYEDPEEFARRLFYDANVSYVDTDAQEKPVRNVEHLATQKNEDWMLVLR